MIEIKKKIKDQLRETLEKEIVEIEKATKAAVDLATSDELKSEGKYDTRAVEASYLAGAQKARLEELKLDLQMIEELNIEHRSQHVEMGALIKVKINKMDKLFFISSALGGNMLNIDGDIILVISVFSPIGNSALSLVVGDSFEVETPKESKQYEILDIF